MIRAAGPLSAKPRDFAHPGPVLPACPSPGAKLTTSCAFGGPNLNELYITSASDGLTEQDKEQQPLAGSLFRAELDVSGVAAFEFAG